MVDDFVAKKKLKRTTWITVIHAFFLGMQYSCIYASLFFYLRKLQIRNSEIYYGTIMAVASIASSVTELLVIGRRFKWFISIRNALVIFLVLAIGGNLLYSLQGNIVFIYIGVFLCGTSDSAQVVVFDSFSKCYEPSRLSVVQSRYERSYTIGFVAGPIVVAMLFNLNLQIGQRYITKYNGIGFILAICLTVVLLFVLCGVSNVLQKTESQVDPYEEENQKLLQKKNYNKIVSSQNENGENLKDAVESDSYQFLVYLFTNIDLILIMVSSLTVSFVANSIEILITVTAAFTAGLNITTYSIMLCGCLFVYTFLISKFWNFYFSHRKQREFTALLVCLVLNILSCGLIMLPNLQHSKTTEGAKRLFLILAILTNSTAGVSISSTCLGLFSHHVPEQYLESIEEFRGYSNRIIGMFGLIFAGAFYQHVTHIYLGFLIFNVLLIAAVIIRKKHLTKNIMQDGDHFDEY